MPPEQQKQILKGLRKNDFRTTMTQDKSCFLSLMCIESGKLRSLSFDDIISDFALAKARKKVL